MDVERSDFLPSAWEPLWNLCEPLWNLCGAVRAVVELARSAGPGEFLLEEFLLEELLLDELLLEELLLEELDDFSMKIIDFQRKSTSFLKKIIDFLRKSTIFDEHPRKFEI